MLTPRHITQFAAHVINIQKNDIVFDPCCGTGGFLVGALDYVREKTGDIDNFKKGNLYGIESDPFVATLAIVNMIFRGDGSSNIKEGDCFKSACNYKDGKKADKVLMNPPFAVDEYEHRFIDRALKDLDKGGLLFAVVPTTTMNSADNKRGEITWRKEILKRHTLLAVVKFPIDLFYPVAKGTYGIILVAHKPHDMDSNVLWAVLDDGKIKSKLKKQRIGNMDKCRDAVKSFVNTGNYSEYIEKEIDCVPVKDDIDLSPERHIGIQKSTVLEIDMDSIIKHQIRAKVRIVANNSMPNFTAKNYDYYSFEDIFAKIEKGASGRAKTMNSGNIPLISTSEIDNGISIFVDKKECKNTYKEMITISSNGGCCYAAYHEYEFAANPDVFVAKLKPEYKNKHFYLFICGAINNERWRFDYCRKFSLQKLQELKLMLPINDQGAIDAQYIHDFMRKRITEYSKYNFSI